MAISDAMKQHLQGTTSLALFLKITARDGSILTVWNGTKNKILDGETYYAFPVEPSQLQASNGLKPDNLEVTAIYSGLFNAATLRAKKWSGARVEYRTMNFRDLSMGHAERRIGFFGAIPIGRYAAKPEILSLSSKLSQPVGRTCQLLCDVVELGDARCKVNLSGITQTGYKITTTAHVTTILNRQQFSIAFDENIKPAEPSVTTAADNLYERGHLTFLSGNNSGADVQVIFNFGNDLTLYLPAFYKINAGDQIRLITGCNRTIAVCRDIYGNAVNNRSFYCLPGRTKLLHVPD